MPEASEKGPCKSSHGKIERPGKKQHQQHELSHAGTTLPDPKSAKRESHKGDGHQSSITPAPTGLLGPADMRMLQTLKAMLLY